MMIPIYLLWHVQITLQQKAVLGACLCLSIMTIFTSVIRVSGIRFYQDKSDLVWQIFWQASETAIAITMVSLSAFWSFFIAHESRSRVHRNRPGYMSRKKPLPASIQKRRLGIDSHEMEKLPHIPRATLTGMRTFIRGKTHSAELIMRTEQTSDGSDSHLVSYEVNPENSRWNTLFLKRSEVSLDILFMQVKLLKMSLMNIYQPPKNVSKPQAQNLVYHDS